MSSLFSLILGFPVVLGLNYGILHPIKGLLDEAVPAVDVILVCGTSLFFSFANCPCPFASSSIRLCLIFDCILSLQKR